VDSLISVKKKLVACDHIKVFIDSSATMTPREKSFATLQSLVVSTQLALTAHYPEQNKLLVSAT